MSYKSGGVSLKNTGYQGDSSRSINMKDEEEGPSYCFDRCKKSSSCPRVLPCFYFKTRKDNIFCGAVFVMLCSAFLGIILPLVINAMIDDGINSSVVIDSTSATSYGVWVSNKPGSEGDKTVITFDLYYFDVKNPEGIIAGEKPIVNEVGPYAFREYFEKLDVHWTDDGDTVTYNTQKYYVFDPTRTGSGLSVDDKITLPYTTVMGFQYMLESIPFNVSAAAELAIQGKVIQYYQQLEGELDMISVGVANTDKLTDKEKYAFQRKIKTIKEDVTTVETQIMAFVAISNPTSLIMKLLLASIPSGISPFWVTDPIKGYFGWLQDPMLVEVQMLINAMSGNTTNSSYVPWTTSVVGSMFNWTDPAETRRRRAPDTMKTGKKNKKQVGQYVRYENMTLIWSCTDPAKMQNPDDYIEGEQYPACPHFQHDWTAEQAEANGYVLPFANPYANRIKGSNGEMFGRPITTERVQVFVGDIYRTAYFIDTGAVTDLYDLKLTRYQLQHKEMLNATAEPDNAQYFNFAPSGMLNLTGASGAPAWVSNPHFLEGDQRLVDAITGLSPDPNLHKTYLDIEPQTGQLVRGRKALQSIWRMTSFSMPVIDQSVDTQVHVLCNNIESLVTLLANKGMTNMTINCNLTVADSMFDILTLPSTWKYQNDEIYLPYVWCAESNVISADDAQEITDSIYDTESFSGQFQRWCFIISGGAFVVLAVMLFTVYSRTQMEEYKFQLESDADTIDSSTHNALNPLMWNGEPASTGLKLDDAYSH